MTQQTSTPVNILNEITAMTEYLATRWEGIPSPVELFKAIHEHANYDARAWVDQHGLFDAVAARETQRKAFLGTVLPALQADLAWLYDQPSMYLSGIRQQMGRLYEAGLSLDGKWDYDQRSKRVFNAMVTRFPALRDAKPLGWDALRAGYTDTDGMDEYCESQQTQDEAAFRGSNVTSTMGGGFVGKTALPYVMYDEVCQSRKAPEVLVAAVYSHFMMLKQAENTRELLEAFLELDLRDKEPGLVYKLELSTANSLMQALLVLVRGNESGVSNDEAKNRENFEKACLAQEEHNMLSDAEKAERVAKNRAAISALLSRMHKASPKVDRKHEERELKVLNECQAVLNNIGLPF